MKAADRGKMPVSEKIEVRIEEEEPKRRRRLSGPMEWVSRFVAIGLPVYSFLYIMNLLDPMGLFIYSGSHNAIFLAAVLSLVFLQVPATKSAPKNRVPWYDLILICMSLLGVVYIAIDYEALLVAGGVSITPAQQILALFTIVAVMEAVRRTVGWVMIIIVLFFLVHAKFTYLFPGILHGPRFSTARVLNYLYLSDQGIFGMVLGIATTIIVSFMIFGAFLDTSGAGNTFIKLALALLGHVRGGAAKVAVVGSALFGTVTGSPVAEIGVVGSFTIPLMKRIGYSPVFAGAAEAAAACGGVIDPPVMGAVAFVMADFTGIGYGKIAVAAILPAILYYLSLFFQLDLRAAATGMVGLPRAELPKVREALKESWLLGIPLAVLVIWMMVLDEEPTTSVFIALGALILLTMFSSRNRITLSKAIKSLEKAGASMIDISPICALAGVIVGSITLTGLGINLSGLLVTLAGGSLLVLSILTAVAIYIMGMGVAAIASYILMAVLVAPAMVQMGVPVLVAHFFIFYVGVSMFITPPYAPAAYVAAAMAGANPMRVGFQAMRLAIVAYLVPFVSIFQPALLWQGTPFEIALAAVTATLAVFALSVGFEGYCLTFLSWPERMIWLAGGFLLFIPSITLVGPGLLLFCIGVFVQWVKRRRKTVPSPS
jgi:TRAP transporter 4TM/12TM fusion protein